MHQGGAENIQQARALFQEQLGMFEHPTPIYNIACCEALLGNSREALSYLQKSIAAGYTDVAHIENDSDLQSLRDLDEFKSIVASLKASPQSNTSERGHCQGRWGRWGGRRMKFHQLHSQGIKLMESGTPAGIQEARGIFLEQLNLIPEASSPVYNLACCEALLGNPAESLAYLKKAINAGFTNVNHIENDSDLKSLRDLEEFKSIILSLKPTATTATTCATPSTTSSAPVVVPSPFVAPSVPSAPPAEVPATPAPAPAPTPSAPSAEALQTLENMGFLNKERNVAALQRANGDLTIAVQLLLGAQNNFGFHW